MDRIGMFIVYTSGLSGKYFVGVSTCGGIGAKKVARNLGYRFVGGFHARGFSSGSIGVTLGNNRIEDFPEQLEKARELGKKLVRDIRQNRPYVFQKLMSRLLTRHLVRRIILKNMYKQKDDQMKAVHQELLNRGFIPAEKE
jgi:hypothetical protein